MNYIFIIISHLTFFIKSNIISDMRESLTWRINMNYGNVYLRLGELIKEKGISKTQLSYRAEISLTQINRFINRDAIRIDFLTLAKFCTVLECQIDELVIFEPAQEQ